MEGSRCSPNSTLAILPGPAGEQSKPAGSSRRWYRFPERATLFAAIWGVLDHDDVLWITHERYFARDAALRLAAVLPKDVMWHADPAGRTEIEELRRAGLSVRRGDNNICRGIALVTGDPHRAVSKAGLLASNLVAESRLYRYPTPAERDQLGENPIDGLNRCVGGPAGYLVSRLLPHEPGIRSQESAKQKPTDFDDEAQWAPL